MKDDLRIEITIADLAKAWGSRRVVAHCRTKLAAFERRGDRSPEAMERLRSIWASYGGHFRHARHHRLCERLHVRFPFLSEISA